MEILAKYLYEYDKIVLETDGEGNQTARNVYGTNLITRESNDKKYTYHYNGHGDVTALTEKSRKHVRQHMNTTVWKYHGRDRKYRKSIQIQRIRI